MPMWSRLVWHATSLWWVFVRAERSVLSKSNAWPEWSASNDEHFRVKLGVSKSAKEGELRLAFVRACVEMHWSSLPWWRRLISWRRSAQTLRFEEVRALHEFVLTNIWCTGGSRLQCAARRSVEVGSRRVLATAAVCPEREGVRWRRLRSAVTTSVFYRDAAIRFSDPGRALSGFRFARVYDQTIASVA